MTIPPLVRMRSIISEKNCLEVGGNNELEYQQLQSDDSNSSSNSDLNSPEEIKQRGKARRSTQIFALIPVYLLQICYGMNTGYPAILTPQLRENRSEFPISEEEESWIVSIDNLATPLICILSGYLQQTFGPLRVLMFACFPYCFGWLVVSVANSVHYIYLSRLLVGISHALLTTTVYTVEISSREMRGTYSLLESVLRCFGCLLIYALGFALRWKQIAIFAPLVPICAFICAIFLAPESPVYLLRKQRVVEAHQALFKLYGPNYRVTEEVEIIQEDLKKIRETRGKKSAYLKNLQNYPQIYKPFLIIVTLSIIQQFSGMSILRAYLVKIFDEVFNDDQDQGSKVSNEAYISAIIMGFVRLLASLILANLLRKYNRRHMYFASAGMTIASLVCFATCALHHSSSLWYKWAALVSACLLVFSVQLGIQTLPNLLSGELFPSDIRAFGKGLTRAATCGFLVLALKLFPILQNQLNLHGTFFLFSGILLIALPIVYCILPETKDMGLEMIQNYFTPNKTVFYVDLPKEQTDLI